MRHGLLERLGDDVAGLVDVAQAMRFVENDQVPRDFLDVVGLGLGELVGADDRAGGEHERVPLRLLAAVSFLQRVVALGFEDQPLQTELVLQFLMPLLAQVGGDDDENPAPPFGPALRNDQARLDGLAEAHLVGKDDAARKWVAAGEEGSIDLMRVEIDLGIDQRRGQRLHGVACRAAGEQPRDVLALMRRQSLLRCHGQSFFAFVERSGMPHGNHAASGSREEGGCNVVSAIVALSGQGTNQHGNEGAVPKSPQKFRQP